MQQENQYTTMRPASEEFPGWQGSQQLGNREEMASQIKFGLLKLFIVTCLIVVTLLTTS